MTDEINDGLADNDLEVTAGTSKQDVSQRDPLEARLTAVERRIDRLEAFNRPIGGEANQSLGSFLGNQPIDPRREKLPHYSSTSTTNVPQED